jgi:anti-sigma regulatory factor (Ser/Thr protein kinase)
MATSRRANGCRGPTDQARDRQPDLDVSLPLSGDPSDARRCRHRAENELTGFIDPERLRDVVLVVSELVTNALLHGAGPATFHLRLSGDWLTVWVDDGGARGTVAAGRPGRDELGGRGLMIVDQLADRWGVVPSLEGKSVWATFSLWPSSESGDR